MATDTDWEGIERDFRAGVLSAREIGAAHGVSHTAIQKRAKRDGWERDLHAKVRAKAEAKVAKAAVAKEVANSPQGKATEAAIVEANAEAIAQVRLRHRSDISKARSLAMDLMLELEHQTGNREVYERLAELMADPEEAGGGQDGRDRQDKRLEAFSRAMSLGNRTKVMKDLADTLKSLVALEREAYSIGAKQDEGEQKPLADTIEPQDLARRVAFVLRRGILAANDQITKPASAA